MFLRQNALFYDRVQTKYFFYVPDFYCESKKLAVERDGEIHRFTKKHDAKRDATLNELCVSLKNKLINPVLFLNKETPIFV